MVKETNKVTDKMVKEIQEKTRDIQMFGSLINKWIFQRNELNEKRKLFFEQVYSSGNTYLITPGYCMIGGQKVHPVDTHITIDGPAKGKNRIDLVTLTDQRRKILSNSGSA